jgi:hypothetical protein
MDITEKDIELARLLRDLFFVGITEEKVQRAAKEIARFRESIGLDSAKKYVDLKEDRKIWREYALMIFPLPQYTSLDEVALDADEMLRLEKERFDG